MATLPQPGKSNNYRINTGVYEGPLDLLLDLIEKAELDITSLALAQVTDQYLNYLENLEFKDPTEISYFIVVAARLIQIKSEALLPTPPVHEPGEENPGEMLANQLILYKKFKVLSQFLLWKEEQRHSTFLHIAPDIKVDGILDLNDLTVADLVEAARTVFLNSGDIAFGNNSVITLPRITIREKIGVIIDYLREKGNVSFSSVLSDKNNRLELVVTFLALLELVKQHVIEPHQDGLFAEIMMEPIGDISEPADFNLEFGE
jgi:segregation and condensation protein A